mgnify:CR=1 FL=1
MHSLLMKDLKQVKAQTILVLGLHLSDLILRLTHWLGQLQKDDIIRTVLLYMNRATMHLMLMQWSIKFLRSELSSS